MALSSDRAPDTAPVDYAHVARDVDVLYSAGEKRFGTDEVKNLMSLLILSFLICIDGVLRDFHQPKSSTSQSNVRIRIRSKQCR